MNGPALRMPFSPSGNQLRAVLVAQCALQRHTLPRPLILYVEAVVSDAIAPALVVDLLGQRDREAVEEEVVRDSGRHRIPCLLLAEKASLISDLEVVRARHVRERGLPHVVLLIETIQIPEEAPGSAVRVERHRNAAPRMRHELDDGDEVHERSRWSLAAPPAVERGQPCFEQQLVRHGRRPRRLDDLLAVIPHVARLGRSRVEATIQCDPVVTALPALLPVHRVGRTRAWLLIVVVEAEPVARRQLVGQADGGGLLRIRVPHLQAAVFDVAPLGRIAGVLVAVHPGHVGVAAERPQAAVEPETILRNRAAEREAGVPVLDDRGHLGDAEGDKLGVEVARLRPFASVAAEGAATEGIAARLGNHVEGRSTAIDLTETADDRDLHFRGVRCVVAELGYAAAVERGADVHAVDVGRV